ncbi:MAG: Calx-beta domain-containing protein, partial [Gimesia chilikensis]
DPGISLTGPNWVDHNVGGIQYNQDDAYYLDPGAHAGESASWNFDNLVPGIYRISGYWVPHANRATNTTVTVSGISGGPISQTINQQYLSASLSDEGKNWQDIGFYHVDENGAITVTFTNENADGYVIADAMRIERVTLVTVGDVTVDEDAGTATFTVTSHGPAGGAFSVDYATANGTAIAGSDYTATSGTLNFTGSTAGETQTVTVNLTGDNTVELDESMFLNISNIQASGVANVMIVDSQGTGIITNDDTTTMSLVNPVVAEYEGDSGTTNYTFELQFTNPLDREIYIWSRATDSTATEADGDFPYPASGYFATLAAGATSVTIPFTINGDTKLEDTEFFYYAFPRCSIFSDLGTLTQLEAGYLDSIIFAGADQGTLWGQGAILNDDFVQIIDDGDSGFSLNGSNWVYHPVPSSPYYGDDSYYLPPASASGNTASWQFSNLPAGTYRISGYWQTDPNRATNTQVTVSGITGGNMTQTVNQQTLSADVSDGGVDWQDLGYFTVDENGTITVTMANENADGYVIADAMRIERVSLVTVSDVIVDEDAGTATVTLTATNVMGSAFSVDYSTIDGTALAGSDYTSTSGTVNFSGTIPDEVQTVTFALTEDAIVEAGETVLVNLSVGSQSVGLSQSQVTVTIADNDSATLTVEDVVVNEDAGTATFTVTLDEAVQGSL